MPTFNGFGDLASHMWRVAQELRPAIDAELGDQGVAIANKCKAKFGTYGPGWPALAESTKRERVRLGYSPDDPLFRSGDLQSQVTHQVTRGNLFVGVPDGATLRDGTSATLVMHVHEYGDTTGRIKPRPVFGQVVDDLGDNAHAFMLGVVARTRLGGR